MQPVPHAALYRLIWRWHLYAGLLCVPVIVLLSLSGAVYLFKPQLDAWQVSHLPRLHEAGPALPPNELIRLAQAAVPDSLFVHWELQPHSDRPQLIAVQQAGGQQQVFLNPYSGEVLEIRQAANSVANVTRTLHGQLFMGEAGSLVVELTACWTIFLLLSGLFLWWPRHSGLAGVLWPRLQLRGAPLWKDLHRVTGFWLTGLVLFLLISGLPWTTVWGGAFKSLRTWHNAPVQQEWQTSRTASAPSWRAKPVSAANLSPAVLQQALQQQLPAPAQLSVAGDKQWKLSSLTQNRPQRVDLWLDNATAEILQRQDFADKSLLDRIIGVAIAAHEGQLFGLWNQLLGLFTALGLCLLVISGALLWWRRRPGREAALVAAPPPLSGTPRTLPLALLLLLAALLPLFAASLLVLAAAELTRQIWRQLAARPVQS